MAQKRWIVCVFALAAVTFFTGINWGLPSRGVDPFLFGSRVPWTGEQIMKLAGARDDGGNRGADLAMHPLDRPDHPIVLNDTDARRAEIVRRYRLYSNQPDEMITFRSLARMKPGRLDLDPRLYQYGGLWIYPVGGLLKLASLAGFVTLRTDLAFYLDHPDAFGRFYLVARGYAAMWGLLGVFVVYAVGREWTGKHLVGVTAAAIYASMPVVINAVHEAKPHLPGAVLTLLSMWGGLRFANTSQRKWWLLAAVAAGAAAGMVLTGYAAFAVLFVMTFCQPMKWPARMSFMAFAGVIGIGVFVVTNPYLPYDFFFNRAVLKSNVGNYGTFYKPGISVSAFITAARLLIEGMSPVPAMIAALGSVALFSPGYRVGVVPVNLGNLLVNLPPEGSSRAIRSWIIFAPAILVLIQFVLLAAGKSAEYARFAITLDVVIAITAAATIDMLPAKPREKGLLAALVVAATLYFGCRYDLNCLIDNRADSSRRLAASKIDHLIEQADVLAVWSEPAPYCLPPVNLFAWKILLLPHGADPAGLQPRSRIITVQPEDAAVLTGEGPLRPASPISWADKPFLIRIW